jgi:putative ABC transport system substrate-binding protein
MRRRDFIKVVAGAASALPVAARAQPSAIPVVGYLSGGSLEPDPIDVIGFRQGLNESGYVEGRTSSWNTGGLRANTTDCRPSRLIWFVAKFP